MNLKDLAQKPTLVELKVTEPAIVEKYGDELSFYVFDRQRIDVFAKLATMQEANPLEFTDMLAQLILDADGKPVMTDDKVLPIDVLTEAVKLIGDTLGK
jgi:hypothetical protein